MSEHTEAIPRLVVDTNVLVSALLSPSTSTSASREVLRRCATGMYQPLIGIALFSEYEDVLYRPHFVDAKRRKLIEQALDGFVSLCEEVRIFFRFRPNLRDEKDNHVVELALAGKASVIVTFNKKDFQGELLFPQLAILTPGELLKQ
ncbi:MAG: putative toxin-antitoxin system toxin component, PIN family [Trueperaceae bacterium]